MSPKAIKSTTLHTVPAQVQWCYFFHVAAVAPEWWKFLFLRDRQRNECGRSNSRTTPLRPPNPTLQPRFWELSVVGTVMFLGTPGKPTKPLRWRSCLRLRADSHRFVTFWPFLFKCFGPLPRTHSRRWKFLAKKNPRFEVAGFSRCMPHFGQLGCRKPKAKRTIEQLVWKQLTYSHFFVSNQRNDKENWPFFFFELLFVIGKHVTSVCKHHTTAAMKTVSLLRVTKPNAHHLRNRIFFPARPFFLVAALPTAVAPARSVICCMHERNQWPIAIKGTNHLKRWIFTFFWSSPFFVYL